MKIIVKVLTILAVFAIPVIGIAQKGEHDKMPPEVRDKIHQRIEEIRDRDRSKSANTNHSSGGNWDKDIEVHLYYEIRTFNNRLNQTGYIYEGVDNGHLYYAINPNDDTHWVDHGRTNNDVILGRYQDRDDRIVEKENPGWEVDGGMDGDDGGGYDGEGATGERFVLSNERIGLSSMSASGNNEVWTWSIKKPTHESKVDWLAHWDFWGDEPYLSKEITEKFMRNLLKRQNTFIIPFKRNSIYTKSSPKIVTDTIIYLKWTQSDIAFKYNVIFLDNEGKRVVSVGSRTDLSSGGVYTKKFRPELGPLFSFKIVAMDRNGKAVCEDCYPGSSYFKIER